MGTLVLRGGVSFWSFSYSLSNPPASKIFSFSTTPLKFKKIPSDFDPSLPDFSTSPHLWATMDPKNYNERSHLLSASFFIQSSSKLLKYFFEMTLHWEQKEFYNVKQLLNKLYNGKKEKCDNMGGNGNCTFRSRSRVECSSGKHFPRPVEGPAVGRQH